MKKLYLRYRYKSFRKALIYKKLHLKRTKFRRKQYAKLKHLFNWNIYVQIWQRWICDFDWNFYINKFYYFKNFNEFEIISYNSYFFNTKKIKLVSNYLFFINCFISRKMNYYLNNKNFKIIPLSFFFIPFFSSYFSYPSNPLFNDYNSILPSLNISSYPLLFNFDNFFFNIDSIKNIQILKFDISIIYHLFFTIFFSCLIEIRKLLIFFYFNLF